MVAFMALDAPRAAWIALLILALSLARRRLIGRVLVGVSLGALIAGQGPSPHAIDALEQHRPVAAVVVVQSTPWIDERNQLRCWVRLLRLGQDDRWLGSEQEAYLRVSADGSESMMRRGATVRLRGYLSRPPSVRNGRDSPPGPWRLAVPSARFLELESPPAPWLRGISRLRDVLAGTLERWPDQDAAALVATLWLGERTLFPERWQRALRAWGLAHLTAVSGLHVGVVALMLWGAGAFLPRGLRLALVLVGVAAYAALVGPRPSVIRASIMALIAIGALVIERPPAALNALSVAVVLMVFHYPPVVLDLGFQLSAAATAGLLALTSPIARLLSAHEQPGPLPLALASSLAAQLAVFPIAAPTFALVHPGTALVQLMALPWLFCTLLAGALSLLLSLAVSALDTSLLMALPASSIEALTDLPIGRWANWPLSITSLQALALATSLITVVVFLNRLGPQLGQRNRGRESISISPALLVPVIVIFVMATCVFVPIGAKSQKSPEDSGEVSVTAIDVGQGDALLLRSSAVSILVDGGGWRRGDSASRNLLPALADLGVRRLDAVVLSHPDVDHCDGLRDLTSYVPIAEVWSAAGWPDRCAGELLGRRGLELRPLWRGQKASLGDWRFETLWPPAGRRLGSGNGRSLVLRAEALGRSVLLTGDLDAAGERELLRAAPALRAHVLKVAHHGSKSSTIPPFLDAVAPRVAIIQAGRSNAYGHPHSSVTGRLDERRIRTLRTDRHGRVELRWRRGGPLRIGVAAGSE